LGIYLAADHDAFEARELLIMKLSQFSASIVSSILTRPGDSRSRLETMSQLLGSNEGSSRRYPGRDKVIRKQNQSEHQSNKAHLR
jgi:hypothetical protein